MESNTELIEKFYSAFQLKDYQTMQSCYSDDIVFSDPVFLTLRGDEAKAMWEMLCKNAKEFTLSYGEIENIDDEYSTCRWVASYTFSATGRRVVNNVKAFMKFKDGKIIEHSDGFRLSSWLGQAFGIKGKLLGWTGFMKSKVQTTAKKNLYSFMNRDR